MFPFSIMSICNFRRCGWMSSVFIASCFDLVLVIGWDKTTCVISNLSAINNINLINNDINNFRSSVMGNIISSTIVINYGTRNIAVLMAMIPTCNITWPVFFQELVPSSDTFQSIMSQCPYFNQAFARHIALINTGHYGISNDNACFARLCLTLKDPLISESCIEIKIKLIFFFTLFGDASKVLWRPLRPS